jgi:hypothetical protein
MRRCGLPVNGGPPDLIRLHREKSPGRPAPAAAVKNDDGYDGPSDGSERSKSGYDGPKGGDERSKDRYDGPETGYDGPDPAYGRVKPSAPIRR